MMKVELAGTSYSVALDMCDVDQFAERWPCYGERREILFQFDARNGDLIDGPDESDSTDERGLVALANDAALAGALALGLAEVAAMREPFSEVADNPMTKAEALDYAPQWGSYMTSGDPGACFYGIDINPPAMSLAYLATLYSAAEELSDVLQLRRLALWLESQEEPEPLCHIAESGDPTEALCGADILADNPDAPLCAECSGRRDSDVPEAGNGPDIRTQLADAEERGDLDMVRELEERLVDEKLNGESQ